MPSLQGRNTDRHEAARAPRRLVAVAALALALAAPAGVASGAAVPGELLVRFASDADAGSRAAARSNAGTHLQRRLPVSGLELVRVDAGTSAEAAARRLERQPGVLYAEPNRLRVSFRMPNDPYLGELWGLHNMGQQVNGASGMPDADVDAPEAWDVTTGAGAVAVGVVDSGVTRTHADLAPNAWANPGESGADRDSNGIDDDGNGYTDDVAGWDWVGDDRDPSDPNGHGTHVAGTIGARGDNGTGVTGVAWQASVIALRVLDAQGSGTVADAIAAYAYAGAKGARILNASFGGPGFSRAEYDAIGAIPEVLFVTAAGNDGSDNDVNPQYPCNYDLPNVVCVAATGARDALAGFSNRGARSVDLAAPGTNVLSTWPSGYAYSSGTSMATPHVAGAAALYLAHRPAATAAEARGALLAGVDPLASLSGATVTGGRLNAHATLIGRPPSPSPPAPPPAPQPGSPPSAPASDRIPPGIRIQVPGRLRLRTVLRRGIRANVLCSETCRVRARALIRRLSSRRSGPVASALVAGRDSTSVAASGRRRLVIRLRTPAKRRLARARGARLELRVSATDLAGNTRGAKRQIRIRGRR
jgi:subtilisin family serine protease